MTERLVQTNHEIKSQYLGVLDAMQFVETSRKERPHLEILDALRAKLKGRRYSDAEIERRLAIDEFIVRLLAKHNLGVMQIYNAMDKGSGVKVDGGTVQNELYNMSDAGVITENPDRTWGLSAGLRSQFK